MAERPTLVVGTAGHIDHGKSRLVLALTGTDPDRLPEEKARGMTIDLGFAHTAIDGCDIAFVDVPGHERFLRNMVAGVTGIDLAALVVAADDSVMPQTREHAEVLALLGLRDCLLVLTKMDLVDDAWADEVEEEARATLAACGLVPRACVRTSALTGRGLDELRAALVRCARDAQRPRAAYHWFRLPIDRAFTVAGRGTVVTGSVAHGAVRRDDELELWPAGTRVRVRELQAHNDPREVVAGRARLAVNLAGVPLESVSRGCELATPGYLHATTWLEARLATLRMPGKTLRQVVRARLHIATTEALAEVRLAEPPREPGLRGVYAQLRTATPVVATWGQPFLLRDEAATQTLGGGRILRPLARRWTTRHPPHPAGLAVLSESSARARLEEVVRDAGWRLLPDALLATLAGVPDAGEAARLLQSLRDAGRVVVLEGASPGLPLHATLLEAVAVEIGTRLARHLAANPRSGGVPRAEWVGWMPRVCPPRHRAALAEWLIVAGHVRIIGDRVVPRDHRDELSPDDQRLYDAIVAEFAAAGLAPPDLAALRCRTDRNAPRVAELVALATARGRLVRIANAFWLHSDAWDVVVRQVTSALRGGRPLTVADIRTLLNSTRKYVVPLVEHLDATGITRRLGDQRVLGPKAPPA